MLYLLLTKCKFREGRILRNSFIEVWLTYDKLQILRMYNLASFDVGIYPWSCHHDQDGDCAPHSTASANPLRQWLTCFLPWSICFYFLDFYVNGITQYTLSDFFHLAWLFWHPSMSHRVSVAHPFYCWVTFHPTVEPQLVYPFTCQWTSGQLLVWGYYK